MLNTTDEEKAKLLKSQFKAQTFHFHTYFGDADFLLVLKENRPIGRLYIHRRGDEIRVIDIALLPEHRGDGIGTKLNIELGWPFGCSFLGPMSATSPMAHCLQPAGSEGASLMQPASRSTRRGSSATDHQTTDAPCPTRPFG